MASPATAGTGLSRYEQLDKIGEGTYGKVYKARDKNTQQLVALKCIRLDNEEEGVTCTAIREVSLLKELKHENIVKLLTVDLTEKKLTLVFEFMDMDLKKYLDTNKGSVTVEHVKNFLAQLLRAIEHIHDRQVLHRDLKPQNLLINLKKEEKGKLELKLADFGLGKSCGIPVNKLTSEVVTLWYRAPDILLGNNNYGNGVDLWAVGCIFAEMVTGKPIFAGRNDQEQLQKIIVTLGTPDAEMWPSMGTYPNSKNLKDLMKDGAREATFHEYLDKPAFRTLGTDGVELLKKHLKYEPSMRISAAAALKEPFITSAGGGATA